MTQVEKMWKAIQEVKNKLYVNEGYGMKGSELAELCDLAVTDVFAGVCDAFDYGFIKGVRYQKAQEKKKRKAVKA